MKEKVNVTARIGNTVHPKYGRLEKGQALLINKADLSQALFEPITLSVDETEKTDSGIPELSIAEEKED